MPGSQDQQSPQRAKVEVSDYRLRSTVPNIKNGVVRSVGQVVIELPRVELGLDFIHNHLKCDEFGIADSTDF
jgi:hypothetical protein